VSPLRWTAKSTRALAAELTRQGHRVSADTVGDLLRAEWFSLQGNAKTIEGKRHPDRDAQFRYISEQASAHQAAGQPVISVDRRGEPSAYPRRSPPRRSTSWPRQGPAAAQMMRHHRRGPISDQPVSREPLGGGEISERPDLLQTGHSQARTAPCRRQ
jgi:hypothetical protein